MSWNNKIEEIKKEDNKDKENIQETQSKEKRIIVLYGQKGVGKTYNCYSLIPLKSKVLVISFDGMSQIIAERQEFKDIQFKVVNVEQKPRFILQDTGTSIQAIESVENSFYNLQQIFRLFLNSKNNEYDFVIIDGFNIAQKIAEAYMRYNHKLRFTDNFANLNLWKERNAVLNAILKEALRISKKGLIYTLYTKSEIEIIDGVIIKQSVKPNYVEDVMTMSDIVIKIETKLQHTKNSNNISYYMIVETAKKENVKIGVKIDITNKKLIDIISVF